ncbi:MAG: transposase [Planctomycetia bacterium]|nr:transposase [Planctomycetia bacterium]
MLAETLRTRPMRVCGYCLMPNHWHMLLWPEHDGEVSSFLQHLTNLHVKRWKEHHSEVGFLGSPAHIRWLSPFFRLLPRRCRWGCSRVPAVRR